MPAPLIALIVVLIGKILWNLESFYQHLDLVQTCQTTSFLAADGAEVVLSSFVLIALLARRYAAIRVFRPYIILSIIVDLAFRGWSERIPPKSFQPVVHAGVHWVLRWFFNSTKFAPEAVKVTACYVIWFQWLVDSTRVRQYLNAPSRPSQGDSAPVGAGQRRLLRWCYWPTGALVFLWPVAAFMTAFIDNESAAVGVLVAVIWLYPFVFSGAILASRLAARQSRSLPAIVLPAVFPWAFALTGAICFLNWA